MLISIIIPAFNEENLLSQTIERINFALDANKGEELSWEIIVCDNNSTDKSAEIASELGARVVFEPTNHISRARNTAARMAQGEWFLFIDADSFPTPELIAEMLSVIDSGNYIGCGTTVLVEGGTLFNKLRMERLNPFFRLLNISGGVFLLCRRDAFQSIRGFSTSLYAFEEFDFIFRLKKYGRSQGKKFTIIHRHPVITSGRKADYNIFSLGSLYVSNFLAIILFILYYLLPKALTAWLSSKLLGYWYKSRQ
jgi:glycosyltransferase involved in cell wall biosynthesis